MSIADFTAFADVYRGRIILNWTVFPDEHGALPTVALRRKQRDFDFPADAAPHLIYDSAIFPPTDESGVREVHRLPEQTGSAEKLQWIQQTWTVSRIDKGQRTEVLRRTERTYVRQDGALARCDVELIDAGDDHDALEAGSTYYYRLDVASDPSASLRATATPTGTHRYDQVLYDALPVVYRRHDTVTRPTDSATELLPEATAVGGQLRRLIDVFGATVGALRGSADGLRVLRDIDLTDARFLPVLAQWIGWDITDDDIARQRNEILAAPYRYGTVGTLTSIRDTIEHYTGWSVQIAESAQNISLTNTPPQANVFAAVESVDGRWSAPDDAAAVLGLAGLAGPEITGTASEPFSLTDAMSIAIAVDHCAPMTMRLSASDFVDITAATAPEVAEAIGKTVRALDCAAVGGKVVLRSHRSGAAANVAIVSVSASLVTLDGAARGRLSAPPSGADAASPGWLAYAATTTAGGTPSLWLKARLHGRNYDAWPIGSDTEPQADPALVATSGRLWCAWVSDPDSERSRLCYRVGSTAELTPARLRGDRREPFPLADGQKLTISGSIGEQTFTVDEADYPDVSAATAGQVQAAMTAQLDGVAALVTPDLRLELTTTGVGPGTTLRVRPEKSTAARILGFGAPGLVGLGDWDPAVQWGPAHDVPNVAPGRHADCTAVAEADGAVRLCWSTHDGTAWHLVTARWAPRVLAASAAGVNIVSAEAVSSLTAADGLPTNNVRDAVGDATGAVWLATAAGVAARSRSGAVTVFTTASTGGALGSDDVRSAAAGPDGTMWFATSAGVSRRTAANEWHAYGTPEGLPSGDVRDVAVALDGAIWAATAAGVAVLRTTVWQAHGAEGGVPAQDARRLAAAADGSMWVATSAGVTRFGADGAVATVDLSGLGAGATSVRDLVADGTTMWLATAGGVMEFRAADDRVLHGVDAGIDDLNCRAITVADGEIWVATGTAILARGGDRWSTRASIAGVTALCGPWSTPLYISNHGGGERDPHLALDGAVLLLAAARRTPSDTGGTWRLTLRRQDADASVWSDANELTADGAIDREPVIAPVSGGRPQVYFRSNRGGGARIWRLDLDADGHGSAPTAITAGPSVDTNPAVLPGSGAAPLLLFRSDRNVGLSAIAELSDTDLPQETSLRRYAGGATVVLGDAIRNAGRGSFGELLDYTPNRPRGDTPAPTERYTPGTITVFFNRGRADEPLVAGDAQRLRQLLTQFLPANVRVVPAPIP